MASRSAADPQAAFHRRLAARHLAALWVARRGVDLTRPRSPAVAALWRYGEMRPDIMAAGALVAAEEAFRRVLVLENPAFPGENRVTNTLYAGVQLVLPGEIAPCHRHSQTALRFVIEGEGAATTVDGERGALHPGDFAVTPSWAWHDHANTGSEPVVWMDALDTPLVGFLDTVFRETYAGPLHPLTRADGDAAARFGATMLPIGQEPVTRASPTLVYPYARTRAALAALSRAGDIDPRHGIKMQYVNPTTGGPATPTMAAFLQLLPAGFTGAPRRATDGAVFCVAEGHGRLVLDESVLEWWPHDIFAVPGWHRHRLEAEDEAVLFSFSDEAAQRALGLWREE